MKKITTRQIVITGLFLAIEIIFQVIGNYLQFGPVNINLSLITIVLAAAIPLLIMHLRLGGRSVGVLFREGEKE